jgi:ribonuclease HI
MAAKAKFYVVWKGRQTGIFIDWESCAAQVNGFPEAQYKAFATRAEAERAFAGEYATYAGKPVSSQKWLFAPNPPIAESYVVDAACSGSPGPMARRLSRQRSRTLPPGTVRERDEQRG